jgi:hypothetical protein
MLGSMKSILEKMPEIVTSTSSPTYSSIRSNNVTLQKKLMVGIFLQLNHPLVLRVGVLSEWVFTDI